MRAGLIGLMGYAGAGKSTVADWTIYSSSDLGNLRDRLHHIMP